MLTNSNYALIFIIIGLFLFNSLKGAASSEFKEICLSLEHLSDSSFYESFPYDKFAKVSIIENPKFLNNQFDIISDMNRNPVKVVNGIFDTYLEKSINDTFLFDILNKNISIGEMYSKSNSFINDTSFVFREFGDKILGAAHQELETFANNNIVHRNSFEYKFLERRLADNKYIIDAPMSNMRKGIMHLKNRNFAYLIKRVWGDYPFICVLTGLVILFMLLVFYKLIRKFFIA